MFTQIFTLKIWHEGDTCLSLALSAKKSKYFFRLGHNWPSDEESIFSFKGLSIKRIRINELNGAFLSFSINEIRTLGFFDIWLGQSREAKWDQKGLVSIVSTGVTAIFLICLLLPTLLNKSLDFFNLLVWAFIYIKFNGHMQNLGLVSGKTWIL